MGSKMVIMILGLFAMLILISSEVTATNSKEVTNKVGDAKYPSHGGNGGGYSGRGGGYPGRGGGYGGRGGGHCRYGCCGGSYGGGCRRCCYNAGKAVAAQIEDKTHY